MSLMAEHNSKKINSSCISISSTKQGNLHQKIPLPNFRVSRNKSEKPKLEDPFAKKVPTKKDGSNQQPSDPKIFYSFLNGSKNNDSNLSNLTNSIQQQIEKSISDKRNRSISREFSNTIKSDSPNVSIIKKPMVNLANNPLCIENDLQFYFKYLSPTKKVKHMSKTKKLESKHGDDSCHSEFFIGLRQSQPQPYKNNLF